MKTARDSWHGGICLSRANRKCPPLADRLWRVAEWVDKWLAPRLIWLMIGAFGGYVWMVTAFGLWPRL